MKNRYLHFLILALIFIFFYSILKDTFQAKFSIVDDHEIIENSYNISKYGIINNYLRILKNDLELSRFRPAYWIARNTEFAVYLTNPFYYKLNSFFIIVFGFYFFYLFAFKLTKSVTLSFFLVLVLSVYSFWSDIYTRLAVNEKYSFLFLNLWLLSIIPFFSDSNVTRRDYVFFVISVFFLTFSKENFFIFLPISILVILFRVYFKKKLSKLEIFSLIIFTIFLLAGFFFFITIKSKGIDVYGRPTSFLYRILLLKIKSRDIITITSFFEFLLLNLVIFTLVNKRNIKSIIFKFVVSLLIFIMIVSFNIFVNLGEFLGPRYYFPVVVLHIYFIPFIIYLTFENNMNIKRTVLILLISFYLITKFYFLYPNINDFKTLALKDKLNSQALDMRLNNLTSLANSRLVPLVFIYNSDYYEAFYSLNKHLTNKGLKTERYLFIPNKCRIYAPGTLGERLCNYVLDEFSKNQNKEIFEIKIIDKDINIKNKCIIIKTNIDKDHFFNCEYEFDYNLNPL